VDSLAISSNVNELAYPGVGALVARDCHPGYHIESGIPALIQPKKQRYKSVDTQLIMNRGRSPSLLGASDWKSRRSGEQADVIASAGTGFKNLQDTSLSNLWMRAKDCFALMINPSCLQQE
jgi:uncharacterized protein YbaR (Trm112 family)